MTFDQDLSGTFKNSSTSGSLKWNIVIDPKSGKAYFVLKENGNDVDVTTSSWSPYYLDDSIYYTVSFKSSDNKVSTLYGKLCKTDSYKTNGLTIYGGLYLWGYLYDYALYNCISFFGTGDSFKVSIKSDYGSYSLGVLDMSGFPALVYDDSPYKKGVQLMEAGKYQEALKVFEEYEANDAVSYAYFKTDEQVEKCKNELEKTGAYFVGRLGPTGGNQLVGTDTAIGYGKSNTEKLVNAMGDDAYRSYYSWNSETTSDYAARLCSMLEYGHDGALYDDWFLPSKDELNLMYQNLKKNGLGSFADYYSWSSSEINAGNAWGRYFISGSQDDYYRYYEYRVRPIRAF